MRYSATSDDPCFAARIVIGVVICISCCLESIAVSGQEPAHDAPEASSSNEEALSPAAARASLSTAFKLNGRLDTDFLATAQSPANEATFGDLGEAVGIRRAWLGTEGRLELGRYMAVIDLSSGDVVIRDLFVGIGEVQEGGEYRVGHYLEPLSLEVNTASFSFPFMENSVASLFAPARNWGLSLFQARPCAATVMSLGIFQAGSDANDFETGPGSNVGLTGRMAVAPIHEEEVGSLVHLGVALSARFPEQGTIIVNQQPQTPLLGLGDAASSPFIPQIQIPASYQQLANLQLSVARETCWLQFEWYGSWMDQLGGGPIFFHGFYVSGGWFLTGEHRPYQEANGTFGPVKVSRPMFCRRSDGEFETGWGAWEFAARFAYVDLQDPDTPTGPGGQLIGIQLPEFTVGLNWYLTDHVRLMGNYSCALPNEPNAGTRVAHIFGMRIGLFW